jgi:thiol-disulfide isomerase/thioredoxin
MRTLIVFLLFSIATYFVKAAPSNTQEVRFIPTESDYFPFLVNGWDPTRPTVTVFKDPYCPYCIKAIPKLPELVGYNVFLFWAPILGQSSLKRVDDIFHCDSPSSNRVLQAVFERKNPFCKMPLNHQLLELNQQVVDNYQINSVPRFYLQGQSISFAMLKQMQKKRPPIYGVNVNWQRFNLMQYSPRQNSHVLSLIVPLARQQDLLSLINKYQPEFLFLAPDLLESYPQFISCMNQPHTCLNQSRSEYTQRIAEFRMLFGDSLPTDKLIIVDHNGRISTI